MSTPANPSRPSSSAGDERNLVAVDATTALSFEDKLRLYWEKNRNVVVALCAGVILAIAAKGAWDYFAHQKEVEIGKAYAAATTPEQLKAFAAAHSGHALAGVARLRLADDSYKAGKAAEAIAGYDAALTVLPEGPLAARAKVGRALAQILAGKTAEATKELKQMADDAKQFKAVRTEAAYHLTSLAVEAGNATEAQKYVDQLMQIDASSAWTQRAISLRTTLPATPATPAPATTEVKAEAPKAGVQVKLPGK